MRSSLGWLLGCCLTQYLLALSPGSSRSLDWQAKRLEIKVYLSFNQQNSDKMELLQLILSSASAASAASTYSIIYLAPSPALPPLYLTLSQ